MTGGDAVRLLGISRSFGPVQALRGADLSLARGEIHALLGENGAGKSTLMHILFGRLQPESGAIEVEGARVRLPSSAAALDRGIGMVQQHHAQVDTMTVAEHVWLGRPGWRTDLAAARGLVAQVAGDTGLVLDPEARAGGLPIGMRQRLEIVRVLARAVRVLILDEPTSTLAPQETGTLFAALDRLRRSGVSIVLITHKLEDALAIADRVTVLRQGRTVLTQAVRDTTAAMLAAAMIGAAPADAPPPGPAGTAGAIVLSRQVAGTSLELRAGEIVGVAAVEGNGQRELLQAIAESARAGDAGFIPGDRQREGLILDFSIEENLALGRMSSWLADRRAMREFAAEVIQGYAVASGTPVQRVAALSGGNQQKIVLARALADRPAVLVADNPTRGLDLHATAFVHEQLRQVAARGGAVLFHSSDLDEVLALSHRVLVMHRGRIRDLPAGERTRERIGSAMLGLP